MITGDITQIDLPAGRRSGLVEAIEVVGKIAGIGFVYFNERDVVRHNLVQQIIKAYDEFGPAQRPAALGPGNHAAHGRADGVPSIALEPAEVAAINPGPPSPVTKNPIASK